MICITAKVFLSYFVAMTFPADNPLSDPPALIYWQGSIARGMPIRGYGLQQIKPGSAEITTPDGRKFEFGADEISIDCPLAKCEGQGCKPIS